MNILHFSKKNKVLLSGEIVNASTDKKKLIIGRVTQITDKKEVNVPWGICKSH